MIIIFKSFSKVPQSTIAVVPSQRTVRKIARRRKINRLFQNIQLCLEVLQFVSLQMLINVNLLFQVHEHSYWKVYFKKIFYETFTMENFWQLLLILVKIDFCNGFLRGKFIFYEEPTIQQILDLSSHFPHNYDNSFQDLGHGQPDLFPFLGPNQLLQYCYGCDQASWNNFRSMALYQIYWCDFICYIFTEYYPWENVCLLNSLKLT